MFKQSHLQHDHGDTSISDFTKCKEKIWTNEWRYKSREHEPEASSGQSSGGWQNPSVDCLLFIDYQAAGANQSGTLTKAITKATLNNRCWCLSSFIASSVRSFVLFVHSFVGSFIHCVFQSAIRRLMNKICQLTSVKERNRYIGHWFPARKHSAWNHEKSTS